MRIGLEDYGVKSWASSYGRLYPTALTILGDDVQILRELRRLCADAMDGGVQRRVQARTARARQLHTTMYDRLQQELRSRWWEQKPTSTARLAAEIWEAIKGEDWVLVHGSLSGWERRLWEVTEGSALGRRWRRYRHGYGRGTGGGPGVPGHRQGVRQHSE